MIISNEKKYVLAVFALGFVIRSIPNLTVRSPIGYDAAFYAAQILDWRSYFSDPNTIFKTPIFPATASLIHILTNADPFIIINIFQILLYGFLGMSFYYVSRKLLKWNHPWSFLATTIFLLQTVTLRISWDLLRNELGLAILLYTLIALRDIERRPIHFAVLSALVVLSHQVTTIILLVTVISLTIHHLYHGYRDKAKKLIIFSIPALLLGLGTIAFAAGIRILPTTIHSNTLPKTIVIPEKRSLPFPFTNYLAGEAFVNYSGSYINLITDIFALYIASYLPLLPLIFLGVRKLRERTLDMWTAFCTAVPLVAIISPSFALISWERFTMMLIVPYTFYATKGIMIIHQKWASSTSRRALVVLTCGTYASIAVLYLLSPPTGPISPYAIFSPSTKYSPATMLRQATPIEDIPNIEQALKWYNENAEANACLLTRETFVNWAKIRLRNEGITIIDYSTRDVSIGLQYAMSHNYTDIYWIWWENGVGLTWYGQEVPSHFRPIYNSGDIIIYRYH